MMISNLNNEYDKYDKYFASTEKILTKEISNP